MQRLWDAGGMTLSGLCLVHCLVLPFLGALLPLAGALAEDERVHIAVVALAAPAAWFAFAKTFRRHWTWWWLPLMGFAGLGLLIAGLFAGEPHEVAFTVAGGVTLAAAHLINLRTARHDGCAVAEDGS